MLNFSTGGRGGGVPGLISTSSGSTGASKISAASLENGSVDNPWKDLAQSTFSPVPSSRRVSGASLKPDLEMEVFWGLVAMGSGLALTVW